MTVLRPLIAAVSFPLLLAGAGSLPSGIGALASAQEGERISRPGEYRGYSEPIYDGHEMISQYVEVRDGTRLAIDIFRPTQDGEVTDTPYPVLWMHSPYNRRTFRGELAAAAYPGQALELVQYGYVVAIADFRGLYASFGTNRGFNRGEWQDEAWWDAYDITEWLADQPFSNGNIGMWGCSATGGSQMQAMATAPPSLKAVFPMSCEWDAYPFVAFGGVTPPEGEPTMLMRGGTAELRDRTAVPVDGDEDRQLLEAAIAGHDENLETPGSVPYRDSHSEAFDSQWWLKSSPYTYEEQINDSGIAVYSAVNWDEEGPGYGPAFTFNNITNPRKIVFGPGEHCAWTDVLATTGFDIRVEELRFFDHWLKGIDNGIMDEPPVYYYTYHKGGEGTWDFASDWPLPQEQRTAFQLGSGSLDPDAQGSGSTETTVDYGVNDSNFHDRGMTFTTAPLEEDMQVTGHPVLELWLSSTATDADVIARIDEVAPDGSSTYYTVEGRLRASLRETATPPYDNLGLPWHPFTEESVQPLEPGEPVLLEFDFYPTSMVFREGHRIRLTLNFAEERATVPREPAPMVTVHHNGQMNSSLILPVIPQ